MRRFFRRAGTTSRQDLERQAAEELRAASGLPQPAAPLQDHPAGRDARTDEEGEDGDPGRSAAETTPMTTRRRRGERGRGRRGPDQTASPEPR